MVSINNDKHKVISMYKICAALAIILAGATATMGYSSYTTTAGYVLGIIVMLAIVEVDKHAPIIINRGN